MIVPPDKARTTVFCAVWSRDEHRHALLRGHQLALEAQTEPVAALYVFDEGDTPPQWLRGTAVVAPDAMTIYQAWNVATQVCATQYVMNLNLDDRIGPDAVALLQSTADANEAGLVGGDWRVTYTQAETDATSQAYCATTLPFEPEWPPRPGAETRLGSGTGNRGTLGPATLWRRALHAATPFPWQFENGDPIRIVGDAIWWRIVIQHHRKPVIRLPIVIGNYFSHPGEQAEFRGKDETAAALEATVRLDPYPLARLDIMTSGTSAEE